MSTASKVLLSAVAVVAVTALASVLGGLMIWILGGAHGLDIAGTASTTPRPADTVDVGDGWGYYGGDAGGNRYSKARQITRANVARLAPVWDYRTGDMTARADHMKQAATEGTPILAGDALVFCTPFNEVIALDPASGAERWRFDPGIDVGQDPANQFVCRGVAHWRDADATGNCADRIFMGTNDARLIAVDAATGSRCTGFGTDGEDRIDPGMPLLWPGEFQITSPPVTVGDTVVIGSAIGDNARVAAPAGSVRAFETRPAVWNASTGGASSPAPSSWKAWLRPSTGTGASAPIAGKRRRDVAGRGAGLGRMRASGGCRPALSPAGRAPFRRAPFSNAPSRRNGRRAAARCRRNTPRLR